MIKLGDHITLKGGGTPDKSVSSYWDGEIPWMSVKDLKTDYVYSTEDYITKAGVDNSATRVVPENTLVISTRMAVGKPAITMKPTAINQDLKAVFPSNSLDGKFLFYHFKYRQPYFERIATGATVKGIKIGDIENLKIPLPPLPIQKKIAAILDAADAYRQKTKALIEKYDQLSQSLFLEMFGDPVTNPKGWEVKKFSEVLDIRNGKNQKAVEHSKGIYPIYGSGGEMGRSNDYISDANSVIIGRKGNINKPILVKEKFWHVDTAFGLNPDRSILSYDYLFRFCDRYNFEQHNKTVTIPSLTKEVLLRVKIPMPPFSLQNQFASRIQAIEQQKAQAQESLAQAENLFNSLLQRAFKGELVG